MRVPRTSRLILLTGCRSPSIRLIHDWRSDIRSTCQSYFRFAFSIVKPDFDCRFDSQSKIEVRKFVTSLSISVDSIDSWLAIRHRIFDFDLRFRCRTRNWNSISISISCDVQYNRPKELSPTAPPKGPPNYSGSIRRRGGYLIFSDENSLSRSVQYSSTRNNPCTK